LIVSIVALALALGGTAWAALGANTVGTLQVKNNSLKSKDLKDNRAVKSADVKNDSLTGVDILESTLGLVPNANHADNADNATNLGGASAGSYLKNPVTRVTTATAPVTGTFSGTDVTAPCQAGERAVGGGGLINNDDNEVTYQASHPSPATNGSTPTGWTVRFQVTGVPHQVTVFVVCAG